MMLSRVASLRHLAAPAAASLRRPAPAASVLRSSPLSTTTAKRAPRKAAVPAAETAAATAPQQEARDRPLSPHFDPEKVKRPIEIPFQPQIANTVQLVGIVGVRPVLEEKSPGEYQAVSVIVEKKDLVENDSLQLWIPVIFQGDLAQIAACHLKENDLVYIVGHLSGGEATTKVENAHNKIQMFARSLSFVESNSQKDDNMVSEQDQKMTSRKDDEVVSEQDKKMASDHSAHLEDLWKDVIENPTMWWDTRLNKRKPTSPDFTHKDSGDVLWLSSSPSWVLEKLPPTENTTNSEDLWKDVIENPTKWWDTRLNKRKPTSPDFTHKDSGNALWLSSSPSWVLEKLPPTENTTNSEDLWKDVIENPTKWWDTRLSKRNPKAPDFKHKDSGDALWLSSSPSWVLEKLPPTESTTNSEDLWKDVIENPTKWWDTRLNKPKPKSPDFKHKDSGVALWLNSSPSWVLEKLPPAESNTNTDSWVKATSLSSGKVATNTENWAKATILS